MSSVSSSADLATKYQRLATEYAKLRGQLPVLKDAVLDEQKKCKTLTTDLQSKDVAVRRLEAENESFSFRNAQLLRRVEHLQETLERQTAITATSTKRTKHAKKPGEMPRSQSSMVVTAEQSLVQDELERKLKENVELHSKIFEIESSCQTEIKDLKTKIESLQVDGERLRRDLEVADKDRGRLQNELTTIRERLKQRQMHSPTGRRSPNLVECNGAFVEGSVVSKGGLLRPSSDCSPAYSSAGLAVDSAQARVCVRELSKTCQHIFTSLGNYFTYSEQRSTLYPQDISMEKLNSDTEMYGKLLIEANLSVKRMSSDCDAFLTVCLDFLSCDNDSIDQQNGAPPPESEFIQSKFVQLSTSLDGFACHMQDKVLPFFRKCVAEECRVSWCSGKLESANNAWGAAVDTVVAGLADVASTLAAERAALLKRHPTTSDNPVAIAFSELANSTADLSTCFDAKVVLENRLPTASKKLRCTNECLSSCLCALGKQLSDLATELSNGRRTFHWIASKLGSPTQIIISDGADILNDQAINTTGIQGANNLNYPPKSINPLVTLTDGVSSFQTDQLSTNPFEIDDDDENEAGLSERLSQFTSFCEMDPRHRAASDASREPVGKASEEKYLRAEVESLTKRVIELEREREELTVEVQLLRAKLTATNNNGGGQLKIGQAGDSADNSSSREMISQAGDLALVNDYYAGRLRDLMIQLQSAKSRAAYYKNECECLIKICAVDIDQGTKLNADLKSARDKIARLTDELETTRESYEGQLSSLSEHLAEMSQKMTNQADTITSLKSNGAGGGVSNMLKKSASDMKIGKRLLFNK